MICAPVSLQGQILGGSTIRISWGRSSTSRAAVNAAAAAATPVAAGAYGFPGAAAPPSGAYSGAGGYGMPTFDLGTYGSYGATAATSTSDPYSAYYAAMAQSDPGSYQV